MLKEKFIEDCIKNCTPIFLFDLSDYIRKIVYHNSKYGLIKVSFLNNSNNLETHIFEVNSCTKDILASQISDIIVKSIERTKIPINTNGDILFAYFISVSFENDSKFLII